MSLACKSVLALLLATTSCAAQHAGAPAKAGPGPRYCIPPPDDTREQEVSTQDTSPPYSYVEQRPEFFGNILSYLMGSMRVNDSLLQGADCGRMVLGFIVERTGLLRELKIVRGSGCASLDAEAIRVMLPMTVTVQWKPGRHEGKPVAAYFLLPIQMHFDY